MEENTKNPRVLGVSIYGEVDSDPALKLIVKYLEVVEVTEKIKDYYFRDDGKVHLKEELLSRGEPPYYYDDPFKVVYYSPTAACSGWPAFPWTFPSMRFLSEHRKVGNNRIEHSAIETSVSAKEFYDGKLIKLAGEPKSSYGKEIQKIADIMIGLSDKIDFKLTGMSRILVSEDGEVILLKYKGDK